MDLTRRQPVSMFGLLALFAPCRSGTSESFTTLGKWLWSCVCTGWLVLLTWWNPASPGKQTSEHVCEGVCRIHKIETRMSSPSEGDTALWPGGLEWTRSWRRQAEQRIYFPLLPDFRRYPSSGCQLCQDGLYPLMVSQTNSLLKWLLPSICHHKHKATDRETW